MVTARAKDGTAHTFDKIGFLHKYALTGTEPPLAAAQAAVPALFAVIGFLAARRFQPSLQVAL
jgi:hypothetical protein